MANLPEPSPRFQIPDSELKVTFARSGGKGGQKVNKSETKAIVAWDFRSSSILNDEQIELIDQKLKNRLDKFERLSVESEKTRYQLRNRKIATEKLNELVNEALTPEVPREETKVPKKSKKDRLEEKRQRSQLKELRRDPSWDEL